MQTNDDSVADSWSEVEESDSDLESLTDQFPQQQGDDADLDSKTGAAAQAAKAIEAADDGAPLPRLSDGPVDSYELRERSTRWLDVPDEDVRILDAGPAPPDYAAATAWRSSEELQNAARLVSYADQQISQDERHPPLGARPEEQRNHANSVNIFVASLLAFVALISFAILTRQGLWSPAEPDSTTPHSLHPNNWRDDPREFHKSKPDCRFTSFTDLMGLQFRDPNYFRLDEDMNLENNYFKFDGQISGTIEVRPGIYGQEEPIEVWASYATSNGWKANWLAYSQDPGRSRLSLQAPDLTRDTILGGDGTKEHTPLDPSQKSCFHVWVGVYVNGQLENLDIYAQNSNVDIQRYLPGNPNTLPGFSLNGRTRINAIGGNVTVDRLGSQIIDIRSVSGSIQGNFSLRDSIELRIRDPGSGIKANVHHSMRNSDNSYLITEAGAGSTEVSVLSPFIDVGPVLKRNAFGMRSISSKPSKPMKFPVRPFNSTHTSTSGDISLEYDSEWKGRIDASTAGGFVKLRGDNLDITTYNMADPITNLKHTQAMKGDPAREEEEDGTAHIMLATDSGDVLLDFNR